MNWKFCSGELNLWTLVMFLMNIGWFGKLSARLFLRDTLIEQLYILYYVQICRSKWANLATDSYYNHNSIIITCILRVICKKLTSAHFSKPALVGSPIWFTYRWLEGAVQTSSLPELVEPEPFLLTALWFRLDAHI